MRIVPCTRSLARLYTREKSNGGKREREGVRERERERVRRGHESKISRLPSGFFPGVSAVKLSYPQGERHTQARQSQFFLALHVYISSRGTRKTTDSTGEERERERWSEGKRRMKRGRGANEEKSVRLGERGRWDAQKCRAYIPHSRTPKSSSLLAGACEKSPRAMEDVSRPTGWRVCTHRRRGLKKSRRD